MSNINDRATFIEETGMLFENLGVTRMAGRIMGYLMVTDKEMVSFEELTQVLQASKSSISTNLKTLTTIGFAKAYTLPGDRKTYYLLSPEINWNSYMKRRVELIRFMVKMFHNALELRVNKIDKTSRWLNKSIDYYEWVTDGYAKLLEDWDKMQAEGS